MESENQTPQNCPNISDDKLVRRSRSLLTILIVAITFLMLGIFLGNVMTNNQSPHLNNPNFTADNNDSKPIQEELASTENLTKNPYFLIADKGIRFKQSPELIITQGYQGYLKDYYDLSIYQNSEIPITLDRCLSNLQDYRALDVKIELLDNPQDLSLETFVDMVDNNRYGVFKTDQIGDLEVMWKDIAQSIRLVFIKNDELIYRFFAYGDLLTDSTSLEKQKDLIFRLINDAEFFDRRDCIPNQLNDHLTNDSLIGLHFKNFGMSAEWGTFNKNEQLPINWGLDYAGPNDTRKNSGIGKWSMLNGILELSKTTISDGSYNNLKGYEYQGDTFYIPIETRKIVIGPTLAKIDIFQDYIQNLENCSTR